MPSELEQMQFGKVLPEDREKITRAAEKWHGGEGGRTRYFLRILLPISEKIEEAGSQAEAEKIVERVRRAVR